MTTSYTDPALTAHIASRDAAWRAAHGDIAADHYLETVLAERAPRYAAHVASMVITPDMVQWQLTMTRRHGPYVRVHHFITDWLTALLILRYGEEPDASRSTDPTFAGWPTAFTDADRQRAADLLVFKRWPAFFTTLEPAEG